MAQPAPFEFNPEQNAFAISLSRSTRVQGWLFFIAGGICALLGLVGIVTGAVGSGIATGLMGLGLLAMGGPLLRAARSFQQITETDGMDIAHLMAAIASLRGYYDALGVVSLVVGLSTLLLGLVAGAAR
jgi:hypothetical protein